MSTILKALKRLDETRRAAAEPRTLEEQVLGAGGAAEARGVRPNKWLILSGVTGALLLMAGVAWFATARRAEPPPVATAAPAPQPAPALALPRAIERAPRDALPARGAPIAGTKLDDAVRTQLSPRAARGEPAPIDSAASQRPTRGNEAEPEVGAESASGSAAAPSPSPPPRFAVSSARGAAPAVAPDPAPAPTRPAPRQFDFPDHANETGPEPSPARATAVVAEPAVTEAKAKPAVQDEPVATPDVAVVAQRPEVWVERTQWHPSPDKRSAVVRIGENGELRELREGDALDGVVVKEIRPSGVLFLHDGSEFKRGVGGS